jgi:hypothetical protein
MKKNLTLLSVILFACLLFLTGCNNKLTNPSDTSLNTTVSLSKDEAADILGNKNGVAESEETAVLDKFYKANEEAWVMGGCIKNDGNTIKADSLKKHLNLFASLYKSEQDFRNSLKNISIKTPFVFIYVMRRQEDKIVIKKLLRSPGPNIASALYEEISIVE